MKIVVCIKQVPDTTDVKINPETGTLMREGVAAIINPFDNYALEEALRIRERLEESVEIIVLTMGPPQADTALREAVSMGADSAILVSDRKIAGSDTWATSYTLSRALKKISDFDLILCGKQAIDGDTAQVGPGMSAWLNIPQATYVKKIEEISASRAIVWRMTEEGYDRIEVPLPALFTVVKEINEPRLPSLKGKFKAKKIDIPLWGAEQLELDDNKSGLEGSPTRVNKVFSPPAREKGVLLQGDAEDSASRLAVILERMLRS